MLIFAGLEASKTSTISAQSIKAAPWEGRCSPIERPMTGKNIWNKIMRQ